MTRRDFGMGFFGKGPFDNEMRKKLHDEWAKMPDNEKLAFINKRMEMWDSDEERFSVKTIDTRCEEWMKKTPEEKEEFVSKRKNAFHERFACMNRFFSREEEPVKTNS